MKRFFAGCLALVLILSLLPGAALGTEAEPQVQTQEEPSAAVQAQVTAEADLWEEPALFAQPDVFEEPDLFEPPALPEETEVVFLSDDNGGTVRGTVSLPAGSTAEADSQVTVYLYTPAELDENGRILQKPALANYVQATIAKGEASATFEISGVPAGSYILRVYSFLCQADVLGGPVYYSADGTLVPNAYAPSPLTITGGDTQVVELTLPAAARSISGTLTFDEPVAEATVITLYANNSINGAEELHACHFTAEKGATEVPFTIGVAEGNYELRFSVQPGSMHNCGVNGTLTDDYRDYLYINTRERSITGIRQNGDSLFETSEAAESTVSLSSVTDADSTSAEEAAPYIEGDFTLPDGYAAPEGGLVVQVRASSETATYYLPEGKSSFHYMMYKSTRTICATIAQVPDGIFYSTFDTDVTGAASGVDLTALEAVTVSGTITVPEDCRDGAATIAFLSRCTWNSESPALVLGNSASILPDETQVAYSISLPKDAILTQMSVKVLSDSQDALNSNYFYLKSNWTFAASTSGSAINAAVSLSQDRVVNLDIPRAKFLTGTLSLSPGMTPGNYAGYVYAERKDGSEKYSYSFLLNGSSCPYRVCLPENAAGDYLVSIYINRGSDAVLSQYFYYAEDGMTADRDAALPVTIDADNTVLDLTVPAAKRLSGTLSIEGGLPEERYSGVVYIQSEDGSETYSKYLSFTGPSCAYSVPLPQETEGQFRVFVEILSGTGAVLNTDYYYAETGMTIDAEAAVLITIGTDNIVLDLTLPQPKYLTGTVSIESGLADGEYSIRILVQSEDGSNWFSKIFSVSGTSYAYSFPLPQEAVGAYYVGVRISEGEGVPLNQYFYYSENGPTSDKSKATLVSMGEEDLTVDLKVPKPNQLSGQLVDVSGDAIQWNPDDSMIVDLYQDGVRTATFYVTADESGKWSLPLSPDLAGEFQLRLYFFSEAETNIIRQNYYYSSAPQAVTSLDSAEVFRIDPQGVTELTIYVETGWILSGSLIVPEGGYANKKQSISLTASNGDRYFHGSGSIEAGTENGSYKILVAKTPGTYTVCLNGNTSNLVDSCNLIIRSQELEVANVEGNVAGLDFTLEKARAVLFCTVSRPEGFTDYIGLIVSAQTKVGAYSGNMNFLSSKSSISFGIAIPEDDGSETCQLSYYTMDPLTGIVSELPVYVCQDCTTTLDPSKAGQFSLSEDQYLSFTLLEAPPFVEGRIYCPEGLTETISVYVDYLAQNIVYPFNIELPTGMTVLVGPEEGQVDEDGRRFSTYSLSDITFGAGTTYKLAYRVASPGGGIVDTSVQYLNVDGTVGTYGDADVFTVSEEGAIRVDFTPRLWDDGCEDFILQSPHGIDSTLGPVTYTYTYPTNVSSLQVTFSTRTDTKLTINNKDYSVSALYGKTIEVTGNTLTITMTPTSSSPSFGFAVTAITPTGGEALEGPAATAVYTRSGSTGAAILSDLNDGQPVRVSLVSKKIDEAVMLTGVIYDENGKMLELVRVDVDLNEGSDTATLLFEKYGTAATLKLLLTDGDWIPLMQNLVYQKTE